MSRHQTDSNLSSSSAIASAPACVPSAVGYTGNEEASKEDAAFTNTEAVSILEHGITSTLKEQSLYYGDVSLDLQRRINASAAEKGWFPAVQLHLADQQELLLSMVDTTRMAWLFHCYNPAATSTCLVWGSRWGTLPGMLSKYYSQVFSAGDVYESLRFQAMRMQDEAVNNVKLLHTEPFHIPLPSGTVDLIVLNGLFDTLGLYELDKTPQAAQAKVLKEFRRLLSPQGQLYIGASNRFSIQAMMGAPDASGLSYTSFLPRAWATRRHRKNAAAVQKGAEDSAAKAYEALNPGGEYRTYSYSLWGYRRLLKRCGFGSVASYWCWPDFNLPRMSGPMDGTGILYLADKQKDHLYSVWLRNVVTLATKIPSSICGLGLKCISPTFIMVATPDSTQHKHTGSKGETPKGVPSLQSEVLNRVPDHDSFVRLTLSQDARPRTTFLLLRDRAVDKAVRVVEELQPSAQRYGFQYEETPGVRGRLFRPASLSDMSAAGQWLGLFQTNNVRGRWNVEDLHDEMNRLLQTIHHVVTSIAATLDVENPLSANVSHSSSSSGALASKSNGWQQDSSLLLVGVDRFAADYAAVISSSPPPIVQEHGDFTIPNLMFSESGQIQVIDWEHKRAEGHPFLDLGSLSLSFLRRENNGGREEAAAPVMRAFLAGYDQCQEAFLNRSQEAPMRLATAYYVLRVINRIVSFKPISDPATYLEIFDTWLPLLQLSLDYHKSDSALQTVMVDQTVQQAKEALPV